MLIFSIKCAKNIASIEILKRVTLVGYEVMLQIEVKIRKDLGGNERKRTMNGERYKT